MIKHTPNPKPRSSALRTDFATRRQRPPISHIAHEIVNQLTVLNLVGSRILSRLGLRSGDGLERETEMFERSIDEATLLVQQLADHLVSQEELALRDRHRGRLAEGQVIRLLRNVTDSKS